jgi:hypothetical protein
MTAPLWPVVLTACADCGVGTLGMGEWYTIRSDVGTEAWRGRIKPWHQIEGQMVLCIGCLKKRLGRTLCEHDFTRSTISMTTCRSACARV